MSVTSSSKQLGMNHICEDLLVLDINASCFQEDVFDKITRFLVLRFLSAFHILLLSLQGVCPSRRTINPGLRVTHSPFFSIFFFKIIVLCYWCSQREHQNKDLGHESWVNLESVTRETWIGSSWWRALPITKEATSGMCLRSLKPRSGWFYQRPLFKTTSGSCLIYLQLLEL